MAHPSSGQNKPNIDRHSIDKNVTADKYPASNNYLMPNTHPSNNYLMPNKHPSNKYPASNKHITNNYAIHTKPNDALIIRHTVPVNETHAFDQKVIDSFSDEVKSILFNNKAVKLSHLKPGAIISNNLSRYLDMTKTKKYERRNRAFKSNLHWGQLKLILTEIEFLTKVLKLHIVDTLPLYFVYAGAAPGDHINYLQELFPSVFFELYDPNKFRVKDNDTLKTHVQFFTDVDAKYWAKKAGRNVSIIDGKINIEPIKPTIRLVFCSDIRTEPASSENIIANMAMQLQWWNIMNPELSMFKFRLPWVDGKTTYPAGDIYVQPYPGPTSTESRLVVKANAKLVEYDNIQYESACFYHNTTTREMFYETPLGHLDLGRDGIDNCYDCASMIKIIKDYIDTTKSNKTIRSLIDELQIKITYNKNTIKSQTIKSFNTAFERFKKSCYVVCNDKSCKICDAPDINYIARGTSKATIANEKKALAEILK